MNVYSIIFLAAVNGCTVQIDEETYDLEKLENLGNISVTPPADEQDQFYFSISFCSNQVHCGKYQKANMVRSTESGNCDGIYGDWETAQNEKTVSGYTANFTGSQFCTDNFNVHYTSQFNLLCDPSAGTLGKVQAVEPGSNTCRYEIDIHTNLVCEGSIPIGGDGGGSGGLSGGSILLISLFVLVVIYVIVGFVSNYVREKAVRAPHKTFWCTKLPYWTKTGCVTSWRCTISTYKWCCKKISRVNPEDEKMASGLIGEDEES